MTISINGRELPVWAEVLTAPVWAPLLLATAVMAVAAAVPAVLAGVLLSPVALAVGEKKDSSSAVIGFSVPDFNPMGKGIEKRNSSTPSFFLEQKTNYASPIKRKDFREMFSNNPYEMRDFSPKR